MQDQGSIESNGTLTQYPAPQPAPVATGPENGPEHGPAALAVAPRLEAPGAADIVYAPHSKIRIKIDIDRLTWEDFLEFESLAGAEDNPDNVKRMVDIARRCVVEPADAMKLPMSTLRPVMEAVTSAISGASGNTKN